MEYQMLRLLLVSVVLLAIGCTDEQNPPTDERGLPTDQLVTAEHILGYLDSITPEQIPAGEELEDMVDTAPPMQQLMLGLALAASSDHGAEAPPFLVNALAAESIEWSPQARTLAELLLRRTRSEHHYRAARKAADAALAGERVKRRELETTLEALRQIDREMNHEERQ